MLKDGRYRIPRCLVLLFLVLACCLLVEIRDGFGEEGGPALCVPDCPCQCVLMEATGRPNRRPPSAAGCSKTTPQRPKAVGLAATLVSRRWPVGGWGPHRPCPFHTVVSFLVAGGVFVYLVSLLLAASSIITLELALDSWVILSSFKHWLPAWPRSSPPLLTPAFSIV